MVDFEVIFRTTCPAAAAVTFERLGTFSTEEPNVPAQYTADTAWWSDRLAGALALVTYLFYWHCAYLSQPFLVVSTGIWLR